MVNKPKSIGTAAETAVVRAARKLGFPGADRLTLTGNKDRGDVGLCPGVILEVKGGDAAKRASDAQIAAWLVETETERINAKADVAILVTARAGIGPANAHRWWAHMTTANFLTLNGARAMDDAPGTIRTTLDTALWLIRLAGYGQPLDDPDAWVLSVPNVPGSVSRAGVA